MQISVFGLGYVGSVSAACLARDGHAVIGVDLDEDKVRMINRGKSPIVELGLADLIASAEQAGNLRAVSDPRYAIGNSSLTMFCVGTPSHENGSLNLDYVRQVCQQIGEALRMKSGFHVVVARSTMLPGTVGSLVIPTLEVASGKRAGIDFGVCVNPEFLREGTAIYDYDHPPKTVIGATDTRSSELLRTLYARLAAPMIITRMEVAEAVKYADNCWHAIKVNFANEVGAICEVAGVDAGAVIDVFLQDTKLNISPAYLRPGPPFGGSCLPKDLRALVSFARTHDLELPMINSVLASNQAQIERVLSVIQRQGRRRIGVLGISFKADTDDLRESPMVKIAETLHGRGYDIRVYDPNVSQASRNGANRLYIRDVIPHIHRMLTCNTAEFLQHAETIVVANRSQVFQDLLEKTRADQCVVDLAHYLPDNGRRMNTATARRNGAEPTIAAFAGEPSIDNREPIPERSFLWRLSHSYTKRLHTAAATV
jgi:GDP-mannose 6-dehydrogenase